MCARSDEERKAIDTVLCEFFEPSKTGFTHRRVQKEIDRMNAISAQASLNGIKGNEIKNAKASQWRRSETREGVASQKLEARSYKLEPETPKTYAQQQPLSESRFDVFWESYPKKIGKPAAKRAWRAIIGIESHSGEVLAGLSRWIAHWTERQFIPYPATFLNQRRWEDEVPKTSQEETRDAINRVAAKYAQ